VLIEDLAHDEAARLGIDFETLHRANPRLIVTSVTPFGRSGPFRDYKSHPLNVFHSSGQGYLAPMNSPDKTREPVKGGGLVWEHDAGTASAIATLAALFWRENGGTGQHIDVSKQHAVMHLEKSQLRRYVDEGVSPDRTGMGRLLETLVQGKDGNYVVIILSSQHQWTGLFEAMGSPEWGARPPFDTQAGRSDNYEELRARLQEWAGQHTAEEIFHKIQASRSAAAPVYLAEHFLASEQIAVREYLVEVEHPVAGTLKYPGRSGKFSGIDWTGHRGAPTYGEHNREVLSGLGYSEHRIDQLEGRDVVVTAGERDAEAELLSVGAGEKETADEQ
jgi:crotonobetainyl-CoA:carnitine CoA-transferase CaiB-like acyl-CoA transferase